MCVSPSMYPSLSTTATTLSLSFPDRSSSLTLSLTLIISNQSTYQTVCLIYLSHCVPLSIYVSLHRYLHISIYLFLLIQMRVHVNSTRCEPRSRRSSRRGAGVLGTGGWRGAAPRADGLPDHSRRGPSDWQRTPPPHHHPFLDPEESEKTLGTGSCRFHGVVIKVVRGTAGFMNIL